MKKVNTKKKNRRKKEPANNEDLKDEETEDCTEEGFSFVTDYHNSMNVANFEAYFADLCKKLPANSVSVLDKSPISFKKFQIMSEF